MANEALAYPLSCFISKPISFLLCAVFVLSNFHSLTMPCDSHLVICILLCTHFTTKKPSQVGGEFLLSSHDGHDLPVMLVTSLRKAKASPVCIPYSLFSHSLGRIVYSVFPHVPHTSVIHLFIKHLFLVNCVPATVLGTVVLRGEIHAFSDHACL